VNESNAAKPIIGIIGSDCRTERNSVPDETATKKTNVARTLSFRRFVRGVYKKQLAVKQSGTRTISGNRTRMRRSDLVVNSSVWYATVKN